MGSNFFVGGGISKFDAKMSGKLFDGFPEKALVHGVGWCHIS